MPASSAVREAREPRSSECRRDRLLTLAGPHVVYCSHAGAVVAVEAETGRRAWGLRYPSRGDKTADLDSYTHDAGLVYLPGRPYAIAILAQGLNLADGKAIVAEISRIAFAYFAARR